MREPYSALKESVADCWYHPCLGEEGFVVRAWHVGLLVFHWATGYTFWKE